jgi:hypothetical protein
MPLLVLTSVIFVVVVSALAAHGNATASRMGARRKTYSTPVL